MKFRYLSKTAGRLNSASRNENFTARHNRHSYDSVKFYLYNYLFA